MARAVYRVRPPTQQQPDASLGPPTPLAPGLGFLVGSVEVHALEGHESEMILKPTSYENRENVGEDAAWRFDDSGDPHRCWQTTMIYQHIEDHPRLVR